jgi:CRP-like cAMP-binding protein
VSVRTVTPGCGAAVCRLSRAGSVRVAENDEKLMTEGEEADSLCVVLAGRVEIFKSGGDPVPHQLGAVGPGAILGESGTVADIPRTATAVATCSTRYFHLPKAAFNELLDIGDPAAIKLVRRIARSLAERQRRANERIVALTENPAGGDGTMNISVRDVREKLFRAISGSE